MDNRRGDDPGRRKEDYRIDRLEIEVGKLADHVEEVDDHLRGVAGRESLDTRVTVLEKEFEMHGILLRRISEQFTGFDTKFEAFNKTLASLTIAKAVVEKTELGNMERFREWLKFWGPIIIASLALVVPLGRLTFENWDKIAPLFHREKMSVQKMEREIEVERRGPRGRAVRKRIAEMEKEAGEGQ